MDRVDDPILDSERYKEMYSLIRKLNNEEKAIIMMWLDEKSYEEIAQITGIKRNTIAVKIKRIKEKLVKMSNQ